ncbi:MAG: hypothetical protein AABX60_01100, partial [Nanoarchaeota archaeon]
KELLHLPGGYLFQVNVRGHAYDSRLSAMLSELEQVCRKENTELRVAGSYQMVRLADYRM